MTESDSNSTEAKNRSTSALVIFLLFALPMPFCLFIYHFILWSTEQSAIASLSLRNVAWVGTIGLAVQAVVICGIAAWLWRYTTDDRFKPIYASLLGAALVGFPALILRTLGPNNDQIGSMLQFILALVAALIVIRMQKNIEWIAPRSPLDYWSQVLALLHLQSMAPSVHLVTCSLTCSPGCHLFYWLQR